MGVAENRANGPGYRTVRSSSGCVHGHQRAARLDLAALHNVVRGGRRRQAEAQLDRLLVQLVERARQQEALDDGGELVVLRPA